eukprot:4995368-Prymnesium_polylepis.1
MLIGIEYTRSEPSLEGCETSFHRPIAPRGKATESSLAGVPDVQTVTCGGRVCGSWVLVRVAHEPDVSEPDALTVGTPR